jgi:hypothetical protein
MGVPSAMTGLTHFPCTYPLISRDYPIQLPLTPVKRKNFPTRALRGCTLKLLMRTIAYERHSRARMRDWGASVSRRDPVVAYPSIPNPKRRVWAARGAGMRRE